MIDFAQAQLLDVRWWRRANLLIRSMHHDREIELLRDAFAFQRALVGNGALTEESFKKTQGQAKETFNEICNLVRPWAARSLEDIKNEEVNNLIDLYKRVIGDPNDPEFMAKLEAQAQQWEAEKAARDAAATEDEEARVERLIREHREERERRLREAAGRNGR